MRRALKVSAWAAAGVVLLALMSGAALLIIGNTDSGRAMIEKSAGRLTSGRVALVGLAGSFPRHLLLERVQLSDDRGVWFTAEQVALDWSPLMLLLRRLQIDNLHAASVRLDRLPQSAPDAKNGGSASIPRIDAANLTVDSLKLGAALSGTPATLAVRGNAHLNSLRDMLIDASAQRIDGDGDYRLKLGFDSLRMDAALTVHEPAGGPLENLLALPGLGTLAATLNLHGPRKAELLELSLDAGALRGRAQGSVDVDALSADLDFSLESPALAVRPDVAWQRASVRGTWHGNLRSPRASAHVEFDQLRLPGGAQVAALNGDLTAASGTAALHALLGGLKIPGPRPLVLEGSAVKIDASIRLDQAARPLELSASHRLFSLHASSDALTPGAGSRSAKLELRLPNVGELAALGGQTVRGTALIKAQVHDEGSATRLLLDASASLGASSEVWSGVVGETPALRLSAALTDRSLTLDSLNFTGRAVSLSAGGEITRPATLHLRWHLNAPDLRALSPVLAGSLKGSGTLEGPADAFGGEAQLTSALAMRDSPSGTLSAAIKMRGLPSNANGTFAAQGFLDGAPLQVDIAVDRDQSGSFQALIKRAEWKSARLDGGMTVASQSRGQVHLQIERLSDLTDFLGTNIGGSLEANLAMRPQSGRTHVELHADGRNLTASQFAGNAQLNAQGTAAEPGFKIGVQVPNLRGAKASFSAEGSVNLDARTIAVASAVANYRGQDVHLLAPAHIAVANGISVDDLKLGARQAVLELKGQFSPALDVTASLRQLQPNLINVFAPGLLATGTIEAEAQLRGSMASPTGRVRLTATDVAVADDAVFGLPASNLQASAQLHGGTAEVDVSLLAGAASRLSVAGRAPLSVDGTFDLKISGALDVGMINPLLEARGQHATGDLRIDATVAGSLAAPQITGTVNLSKGSARDYARGLSVTDITAAIIGSEGTLQIKSMTATAAPGKISMSGNVGVLQAGIPVDLTIKAENAQPLASKLVTANLNADLHVGGTARARLDVVGKVHLNRTLIGIPNSLPPNVAVLDVRRRGKTAPVPDRPLIIGLDIAVNAPQEILVQGRGLDAEMGGDLHLSGTADTPVVSGFFELQRGSFSLASSKLNFTSGRVGFNGAGLKNRLDPTLDFTAQTTVGAATTATLRITGLADAPQFEFTSTPYLPQDEIMAQLLFGQSVAQLSALQVAEIGAALATLSGVGGDGGLNPLVKIQKSLGLDRLTVGASTSSSATGTENSGTSIAAGRYISKRVYIAAKQTTTGTSQIETDIELTKRLKLQTRVGNGTASVQGTTPENDPGSSVGLSYQFEY